MWARIRSHLWRQCETWVWCLTPTWKWICKSQKTAQNAYYHLHNIRRIRKFLSQEATWTIIHAFITGQIDYCNSLMNGLPENLIKKLKRVQNTAAKLVFNLRKYDRITPALVTSLASSQIPDWIQNTVDRLQRTSGQGTYLHPRNDHPIKKQKIFHTIQWRTCPEGSKVQAWYFWQACIRSVWASGMELLAKGN